MAIIIGKLLTDSDLWRTAQNYHVPFSIKYSKVIDSQLNFPIQYLKIAAWANPKKYSSHWIETNFIKKKPHSNTLIYNFIISIPEQPYDLAAWLPSGVVS